MAPTVGCADAAALTAALYDAAPVTTMSERKDDAIGPPRGADEARIGAVPDVAALLTALAARCATAPASIVIRSAPRALTIVIAGEVHCLIGPAADPLATLIVTVHELGHGLLAAAQRGLAATLAAPTRVVDEAAAAWAVRALEDAAVIADASVRAALTRRRRRRERLTVALARFEAAGLTGTPAAAAWSLVAAVDPRPPAAFAALFDEPGVMAAYVAADRLAATATAQPRRWA